MVPMPVIRTATRSASSSLADPVPHIGPHVTLNDPAFIHDTAQLFGRLTVHEVASIWPYVVTRAEMHEIVIGARTNIQDHVMIHVGYRTPTIVLLQNLSIFLSMSYGG